MKIYSKLLSFHICPPKRRSQYPEDQRSLIIMYTFKGQEMKRLCTKNNCEFVIVPHTLTKSSSLWILASINLQRNLSQKRSTHGMLIALANNCHYQRFRCCRDQPGYHMCKQSLNTSRKPF